MEPVAINDILMPPAYKVVDDSFDYKPAEKPLITDARLLRLKRELEMPASKPRLISLQVCSEHEDSIKFFVKSGMLA